MRFHLVFFGKTGFPDIDTAIKRYLDRLGHYIPLDVHILKASKIPPKASETAVKDQEAARVLKLLKKEDFLLVWDQRGKSFDSLAFSRFLADLHNQGWDNVWHVIGGPLGVADLLLQRANAVVSLSRMTFAHDLARLAVAEQLYRAYTILKGEPYHR